MRAWPIRRWDVGLLALGLVVAVVVRAILLPTDGFRDDLDRFAQWVQLVAIEPLGHAYRTENNFGPLITLIYWLLGVVQPAFASATDASDPAVRIALKLPGVVADFGIALSVGWLLRDRPRWAIVAAVGVLLAPAIVYTSTWWGQWDSIWVLAGLAAAILALNGRPVLAAIVLAGALMAKPQAIVLLPPFAAFAWARFGRREVLLAGAALLVTVAVLWVPFVADGGIGDFVRNVAQLQGGLYAVLSLRAWNLWWILQSSAGGGQFVADGTGLVGPISPRWIGYGLVILLEILIMRAVLRSPAKGGLLLGLAASVLVCFTFLTAMHERYLYGALVFLAPLIPDRRILGAWLVLNLVAFLNLLAAAPPTAAIRQALPIDGSVGLLGAATIVGLAVVVMWLLVAGGEREADDVGAASPAMSP